MPDDSKLRLDNIRLMEQGRKRWQKHTDYGRRAKVENTIYRYNPNSGLDEGKKVMFTRG